jgi:nuclear pore complex protein Nup93
MGKLESSRRSIPQVTMTMKDWLWFQLAIVDENEDGGLRALAEVLLGYGERHFDGPPNQPGSRRGVWAGVLLMCGQFERVRLLYHSFTTKTDFLSRQWQHSGNTKKPRWRLFISHLHWRTIGLLRVPSRAETSHITPRKMSLLISFANF